MRLVPGKVNEYSGSGKNVRGEQKEVDHRVFNGHIRPPSCW